MCSTSHFSIDAELDKACNLHLAPRSFGAKALTLPKQATISKTPGRQMKIRAVVILVGLAISLALPIFAQEKEEVKSFGQRC
jgi:hypothetical protein